MLYCFLIAPAFIMHTLQGQRNTDKVIDVLTEVNRISLRDIALLKTGMDLDLKILKAPVTRHRDLSIDRALRIERHSVIVHHEVDLKIGTDYLGIAKTVKEIRPDAPFEGTFAMGQTNRIYNKGLQS